MSSLSLNTKNSQCHFQPLKKACWGVQKVLVEKETRASYIFYGSASSTRVQYTVRALSF